MSDKSDEPPRLDLRLERAVREMQERAEGEFRRLMAYAWQGRLHNLNGTEWDINQRGDRMLVSKLRLPRDHNNDVQHAYSNDSVLVRTSRAGHETGRGNATIQVERDVGGEIVRNRLRIQELEVHPSFRGEGLGSALLEQLELQARRYGSTEMYGVFSPKDDPDRVREFYRRHGFDFRVTPGGEQVYKALVTPEQQSSDEIKR